MIGRRAGVRVGRRSRRGGDGLRSLLAVLVLCGLLGAGLWWYRQHASASAAGDPATTPTSGDSRDSGDSGVSGRRVGAAGTGRVRVDLPATAARALALIEIGRADPSAGYSRALFGDGWLDPDGNGCDARNDVLRRDLVDVEIRPRTGGCIVQRGVLHDPYTGAVHRFERGPTTSPQVQIDHVVSLADAWRSGAQAWTGARRAAFANDPLELLAVSRQVNADKDSANAAGWLPPAPDLRCPFVARQVAVKAAYRLRMTAAEHDAVARVLASCPDQTLPGP